MSRLLDIFMNKYPYTDFHELNASWLLETVKEVIIEVDSLDEWKEQHEKEYEELKSLYDDIINGDFPDSITEAFYSWMQENAIDLVGSLIKTVHFGLTNDGYFCAYIPTSWSDVQFDTIMDFDDPLYGHLVLMYD